MLSQLESPIIYLISFQLCTITAPAMIFALPPQQTASARKICMPRLTAWLLLIFAAITPAAFADESAPCANWSKISCIKKLVKKDNNAAAQYHLGLAYWQGKNAEQNKIEAARLYLLSAKQDYAPAQYFLGLAYRDGDGIEQNYDESVRWYYLASEQGHAKAQYDLAMLYHDGDAIFQDDDEAFRLLKQAANQGHIQGQSQLGVFYLNGYGTPYNLKESYIWTVIASKSGFENTNQLVQEWELIMPKDEVELFQQEADSRMVEIKNRMSKP